MIPIIGSEGWFLIPLRQTRFLPAKLAKVRVVDGEIVSAYSREAHSLTTIISAYSHPFMPTPRRHLHWASGVGSWEERA